MDTKPAGSPEYSMTHSDTTVRARSSLLYHQTSNAAIRARLDGLGRLRSCQDSH